MKITLVELKQLIREALGTITLYRGMPQSVFDEVVKAGVFKRTEHPGNVASTDVATALHYAGDRSDESDPGVVVSFDAPLDATERDEWFKDDYRFTRDFKPTNLRIVRSGITEPIHE